MFDKQFFKKSKNVVVVRFCNVKYSVACSCLVLNYILKSQDVLYFRNLFFTLFF